VTLTHHVEVYKRAVSGVDVAQETAVLVGALLIRFEKDAGPGWNQLVQGGGGLGPPTLGDGSVFRRVVFQQADVVIGPSWQRSVAFGDFDPDRVAVDDAATLAGCAWAGTLPLALHTPLSGRTAPPLGCLPCS
jgi:hypothetical protein